jgi:hypothetical protein
MHWGLPYSKKKLESTRLIEVVPHALLHCLLLLRKASCNEPTCDDDFINEIEQD